MCPRPAFALFWKRFFVGTILWGGRNKGDKKFSMNYWVKKPFIPPPSRTSTIPLSGYCKLVYWIFSLVYCFSLCNGDSNIQYQYSSHLAPWQMCSLVESFPWGSLETLGECLRSASFFSDCSSLSFFHPPTPTLCVVLRI